MTKLKSKTSPSLPAVSRTLSSKKADQILQHSIDLFQALAPFAEFARGFEEQQKGSTIVKTGPIYAIENRLGEFTITVEHLQRARKVLVEQGWTRE